MFAAELENWVGRTLHSRFRIECRTLVLVRKSAFPGNCGLSAHVNHRNAPGLCATPDAWGTNLSSTFLTRLNKPTYTPDDP